MKHFGTSTRLHNGTLITDYSVDFKKLHIAIYTQVKHARSRFRCTFDRFDNTGVTILIYLP